jgi:hypothetical protein
MGKISKKVLEKIEKENIKPIGRWSFVLKNSFLWSLFGLNILFGSVGFAISIYLFESTDVFDLILPVNDLLEAAILAIPTVWVLLTIIFLVVAYLNFRYTDRGYILSFRKIFVINTLAILILGGILHLSGVSERLNRVFSESFSTYDITLDPRYKIWSSPETGYLAGTILSVNKESIEIEDLDGDIWSVDISDAKVRRAVGLIKGEKIKIVGNVVDERTFQALEILPWEGRGRNMQEKHF